MGRFRAPSVWKACRFASGLEHPNEKPIGFNGLNDDWMVLPSPALPGVALLGKFGRRVGFGIAFFDFNMNEASTLLSLRHSRRLTIDKNSICRKVMESLGRRCP